MPDWIDRRDTARRGARAIATDDEAHVAHVRIMLLEAMLCSAALIAVATAMLQHFR